MVTNRNTAKRRVTGNRIDAKAERGDNMVLHGYGLTRENVITCIKALERAETYMIQASIRNPLSFSYCMRELSEMVNLEIDLKTVLGLNVNNSVRTENERG